MESLITWLMTFGDKAELLEPQEARREIAQMARKITLMYEHGVNGDLFWNREEKLVEFTDHDSRVLGKVNDLFHRLSRQLRNETGF